MEGEKNITREIFENTPNMVEFYKVLRRKELFSNFIDRDIHNQFRSLFSEVGELQQAMFDKDKQEILKELSDVVFVLSLVIQGFIKEGLLDSNELSNIIGIISEKVYKRSPQLLYGKKEDIQTEEKLRIEGKK